LRERVAACLGAAGYLDRAGNLPVEHGPGTFTLTAGVGVRVEVAWWDRGDGERRVLLERFAVALAAAGFTVEDRGDTLYVAEPG
jgi:hypothetical protein